MSVCVQGLEMVSDPITTNTKVTVKLFCQLHNLTVLNIAEMVSTNRVFVIIHQLPSYHIQGDVWEIQK